jgi:uncharacterized protein
MADLLDVNVWLALAHEGHPHHEKAVNQWPSLLEPSFCRITQLAFLRLLGNQTVMGDSVLTARASMKEYKSLIGSGNIAFAKEPNGLDSKLEEFAIPRRISGGYWSDSCLAAFAIVGGMRLVTFDNGFGSVDGLDSLILVG